jgi:DNA-binding transcriptional MocR family regulator
VLPPGGYGTTIVTRLSGNAALQENVASARLHTKKMLTTQSLKGALSGIAKDTVENKFEETRNRGMIFSLKKTHLGG